MHVTGSMQTLWSKPMFEIKAKHQSFRNSVVNDLSNILSRIKNSGIHGTSQNMELGEYHVTFYKKILLKLVSYWIYCYEHEHILSVPCLMISILMFGLQDNNAPLLVLPMFIHILMIDVKLHWVCDEVFSLQHV